MMKILTENKQSKIKVTEKIKLFINETIEKCIQYEKFRTDIEVSVVLVDNSEIKKINKEFRNIDKETDVISFPMLDFLGGSVINNSGDIDIDENLILLGDVVISLEKVESQAKEYGNTFERELAFLLTHGVFHLLGYDHSDKNQEIVMRSKQEAVLELLNLCRKSN